MAKKSHIFEEQNIELIKENAWLTRETSTQKKELETKGSWLKYSLIANLIFVVIVLIKIFRR